MEFERATNMIDKEGNFIFENKRIDDVSDSWMQSLDTDDNQKVRNSYSAINGGISKVAQKPRRTRKKINCAAYDRS